MAPAVSVGIPTYNRAGLLAQAIQSVREQTFTDWELIVSDDCSTDDTPAVVAGFQDPRIRYHRTAANLRPPRNWNECVRLAQGEFFALLPDDDVWQPEFLAVMSAALRQHPEAGFAQCRLANVDADLRPFATLPPQATRAFGLAGEAALAWQFETLSCPPVCLLFRRAAMLPLGLWREDYWDDWAFILRLAFRRGFWFEPQVLAANRVHGQNLNRVLHRQGIDTIQELINQQADVFGEALPATPALIALRAKLDRQLSEHCILLALGAARRGQGRRALFHLRRARQLYALAGLDPGWIGLLIRLRRQGAQDRRQRAAAAQRAPVVQLGTEGPGR